MTVIWFKKIVLTLILLIATNTHSLGQVNECSWGMSKDNIINVKGNPHSRTSNSLTYLGRMSGLETRVIYSFDSEGLQSVEKEFYRFKKSEKRTREYRKFTYDDDSELEGLISDYFKVNRMLTSEHGSPSVNPSH